MARVGAHFFRRGELALVVLALLEEHPDNPWGILGRLSERFGSAYDPSPGTVYPAIEALSSERLIDGAAAGRQTIYRLTRSGQRALSARRDQLAVIEARTGERLGLSDELDKALGRLKAAVVAAHHDGGEAQALAAVETAIKRVGGRSVRPAHG